MMSTSTTLGDAMNPEEEKTVKDEETPENWENNVIGNDVGDAIKPGHYPHINYGVGHYPHIHNGVGTGNGGNKVGNDDGSSVGGN